MQSMMWVALAVALAVPLLFALILTLILVLGRARPQQGLGVVQAAGAFEGVWNAEILGGGPVGALGGTMASTFGTVHVARGVLTFTPDGGSPWSLPCQSIWAEKRGFAAIDGADVVLETPHGPLRMNVSREHINRLSRNTIKDLRERRYADEFLAVLAANGSAFN